MKNKLSVAIVILLVLGLTSCMGEKNGEGKKQNNVNVEQTAETEIVDEEMIKDVIEPLLLNEESDEYVVSDDDILKAGTIISDSVSGELSEDEIEGLILMREEEKLAYDVYVTLYEKWGQKIFTNISKSEKTHMEAVGELLVKYDIEDPINPDAKVWEFDSEYLQKLYDDLVVMWNKSLVDALKVGATIEDLDIYDLEELLKETNNEDIVKVYDNLLRGSKNHMIAFEKNLKKKGWEYTAQYITQAHYDEIANWEQEKGNGHK